MNLDLLTEISERFTDTVAPCWAASLAVEEATGWDVAGGYYDVDGTFWGRDGHFWNVKPDGTIVDVTHFTYDPERPVMIAAPGSEDAARYVRGGLEDWLASTRKETTT
jgi:hypothetical protein